MSRPPDILIAVETLQRKAMQMVNQARFDEVRQQCRNKLVDIADERSKASARVTTCLAEFEGDSGACQEYIDIHDDLDLQWQSTVEDLNRMDWAEAMLSISPKDQD